LNVASSIAPSAASPASRGALYLDECADLILSGQRQMRAIKIRLSQKKNKPRERCEAAQKDKPVAPVETKKSTIRRNGNEL
jgi:hypothetical protein